VIQVAALERGEKLPDREPAGMKPISNGIRRAIQGR